MKIRLATTKDIKKIHNLMQKVHKDLKDKSLYVCDDLDYVTNQITDRDAGFGVVALSFNRIVGSFIFRYPHFSDDNLGRDIHLDETLLDEVVHMESAVVLKHYRGRGLQLKMLRYAESIIDKRKYHYFLATVSPNNLASCKSFEKNGYKHMLTKEKYDGLIRRIYMKIV